MTLSLQTFADGDTNYVAKLNNNFANIESMLGSVLANMQAQAQAAQGPGAAYEALFGSTCSIIGAQSYLCHGSGDTLTVDPGYCWKPSIPTVVQMPLAATLVFTGLLADTYYISADTAGTPVRSTTSSAEDIYAVAWTGTAFGAITRQVPIVWGADNDIDTQTSTSLGGTFESLDERLEEGEAAAVKGDAARDFQTGRLSLDVSGNTDVTLSADQVNNVILDFTGTLTGNVNVIVPLGENPRQWLVSNHTTGSFSLTLKGVTGASVVLLQDGAPYGICQDGTDVIAVGSKVTTQPFDVTSYYPGSPTATAKIIRVPVARPVNFPDNLTGSHGVAGAAATGSTVFDIQKNGATIGSITFAAGANTATFSTVGGTAKTLSAGDILSIVAPGTPDATLADVGFVLAGTR